MAKSEATTVKQYLDELPADRRKVMSAVRALIRRNLPAGYREAMNWGMITYGIPLKRYPDTYNGEPLGYVALAAQKHYYALYLNCVYQDSGLEKWMREQFKLAGKKLDMGKSCVRFRKLEDLPLDVISQVVASTPVEAHIAQYEKARQR